MDYVKLFLIILCLLLSIPYSVYIKEQIENKIKNKSKYRKIKKIIEGINIDGKMFCYNFEIDNGKVFAYAYEFKDDRDLKRVNTYSLHIHIDDYSFIKNYNKEEIQRELQKIVDNIENKMSIVQIGKIV